MKLIDHRLALNLSVVCPSGEYKGWVYLCGPADLDTGSDLAWWDELMWGRRN